MYFEALNTENKNNWHLTIYGQLAPKRNGQRLKTEYTAPARRHE
jgi:hypothetical protein